MAGMWLMHASSGCLLDLINAVGGALVESVCHPARPDPRLINGRRVAGVCGSLIYRTFLPFLLHQVNQVQQVWKRRQQGKEVKAKVGQPRAGFRTLTQYQAATFLLQQVHPSPFSVVAASRCRAAVQRRLPAPFPATRHTCDDVCCYR